MRLLACLVVMLVPVVATAGPSEKEVRDALRYYEPDETPRGLFAIDSHGVHARAPSWHDATTDFLELIKLENTTIATSTDGTAAWVATRVRRAWQCAGLRGTVDQCEDSTTHPPVMTLFLADKVGNEWRPVTAHSAVPITDQALARSLAAGVTLTPIPSQIDDSAREVVELLKSSIGDPAKLAASVSARKDAVLLGSGPNEKVVGGPKVAATLKRWKLALTVRDGIAAGTTASKNVAWVAANVDARPVGKSTGTPTPYRVMCIYEKAKDWRLVALQFSFPTPAPKQK